MQNIVLSNEQIQDICKRVGKEVSDALRNEERIPILVGVLKGSLNFMLDLMKYIDVTFFTDYVQISSYKKTTRMDTVRLVKDISFDCYNRTIVVVEDIVDTGYSMAYLINHFKIHNPKRVLVCTMFDKRLARIKEVPIDFCGYVLENNRFLIGYGLDYNELERNLPYVYEADAEEVRRLDAIAEKDELKETEN